MTDCLELYWPALVIVGVFCLLIGALIMILMDKFLDWGNEAELRMAHHLNEIDDHATHWRSQKKTGEKDDE